jgi:hypothetical protein
MEKNMDENKNDMKKKMMKIRRDEKKYGKNGTQVYGCLNWEVT